VGKECRRKDGAEERNGDNVFRLKKNEEESGCRNDDSTENDREYNSEKEKKIMTNRDKWTAEINYFAHRLYRAMIWFLVFIYISQTYVCVI
jgi:hypothetical protein